MYSDPTWRHPTRGTFQSKKPQAAASPTPQGTSKAKIARLSTLWGWPGGGALRLSVPCPSLEEPNLLRSLCGGASC